MSENVTEAPTAAEQILSSVHRPKLPPEGFNPLAATARELQLYGIPARPDPLTHPLLAAKWQRTMSRDIRMVSPELHVNRDFVPRPIRDHRRAPTASFDTSSSWSGAYVLRPQAEPFTAVAASWIVPDVAPPPSAWTGSGWTDGTYLVGAWVGIDGWDGSGDVLQAGTASSVTVSGGQIQSKSFRFWYEWYGNPPVYPAGFSLQAGDLISCSVCALTTTHGVTSVMNLNTGQAMTYGFDAPKGVTLAGNVAEWIVEDPQTSSGGDYPFPNYGATFFRDAIAGTKNYEFNLGSATTIALVQGSATLSAAVIESNSVLMCYFGPDGP